MMKSSINTDKENKSVANQLKQEQTSSSFNMEDNRADAIAQAKLQDNIQESVMNSSVETNQRKQASSDMHIQMAKDEMKKPERTQFQVPAVQKMDEEEELMQGKFEVPPVQRMEEEELMQGKFNVAPVQKMDEEELLQGKFSVPTVQKMDEEELMQGKFSVAPVQKMDEEELMQGKFKAPTVQRQENTTGMPDSVKSKMESGLGSDFSDVKIHDNSSKAPDIGALAYTQGSDIHFAPGQFKPDTTGGQQLLGHELTHVVQQREGRVKPTTEVNGMPVNDNPGLENEADVMGAKLAQAKMEDDKINI
jgi:hypothetical protein